MVHCCPIRVVDKQTDKISLLPSVQCGVKRVLASMQTPNIQRKTKNAMYMLVYRRLQKYGVYENTTVKIVYQTTETKKATETAIKI